MSLSDAWLGEGDAAAGEAQEEVRSEVKRMYKDRVLWFFIKKVQCLRRRR